MASATTIINGSTMANRTAMKVSGSACGMPSLVKMKPVDHSGTNASGRR